MFIDLTLLINNKSSKNAQENLDRANYGHLGTHFDVMNKVFPLEFVERKGIVFDVSNVKDRDISINNWC